MMRKPSHDYDVYRIIRAADLSADAKVMLWAIYDHAGPNGTGKCWTSAENLAAECNIKGKPKNLSRRARTLIDELKADGWVNVVPRGQSKHARVRDIFMGSTLWARLGLHSPSDPGSDSDPTVLPVGPSSPQVGPSSPPLGPSSPTHSDPTVLPMSPGISPRMAPLNDPHNLIRSAHSGADGGNDAGASPRGKGNKTKSKAWDQVWKRLTPPPDQWWAWPEDRALAREVADQLGMNAHHIEAAVDLVEKKAGVLLANGVNWHNVAAAIVVTAGMDPDSIRVLPKYINGVAQDFRDGRKVDTHIARVLLEADRINEVLRPEEKYSWRQGAIWKALNEFMPPAHEAFVAVSRLHEERRDRLHLGEFDYGITVEFDRRLMELSTLLDDDGWRRLAEATNAAAESGANDRPSIDDLLSRGQGGGNGRAEAAV